MSYWNQYIGSLTPMQKAMRWRRKKWVKVRRIEDMYLPGARLIPIYRENL